MSGREVMVGGKPLSSLRVIDLKAELEKRGMSKSGSKKELADRLKSVRSFILLLSPKVKTAGCFIIHKTNS